MVVILTQILGQNQFSKKHNSFSFMFSCFINIPFDHPTSFTILIPFLYPSNPLYDPETSGVTQAILNLKVAGCNMVLPCYYISHCYII